MPLKVLDSGGRSWEQKSMKNRQKNEVKMGRHLDIDFWSILVGLGGQVGRENGPSSIRKDIEKWKASGWPQDRNKMSQRLAAHHLSPEGWWD